MSLHFYRGFGPGTDSYRAVPQYYQVCASTGWTESLSKYILYPSTLYFRLVNLTCLLSLLYFVSESWDCWLVCVRSSKLLSRLESLPSPSEVRDVRLFSTVSNLSASCAPECSSGWLKSPAARLVKSWPLIFTFPEPRVRKVRFLFRADSSTRPPSSDLIRGLKF